MPDIRVIYTAKQFDAFVEDTKDVDWGVTALDTETMGRNWWEYTRQRQVATDKKKIKEIEAGIKSCKKEALNPRTCYLATLQLSPHPDSCYNFVLKSNEIVTRCQTFLRELMERNPLWLIQNAKFDMKQLAYHWQMDFTGQRLHDTMLSEVLLIADKNGDSASLKHLCKRYWMPEGLEKGDSGITVSDWWTDPLTDEQIGYMSSDARMLHYIYKKQQEDLWAQGQIRCYNLENRLVPPLVRMENIGVKYDKEKLQSFMLEAQERIAIEEEKFRETFPDVNPLSSPQVLKGVQEKFGVTPMQKKWDKDLGMFVERPSVDKFTLLEYGLRHEPVIESLIAIKELKRRVKLASTWFSDSEDRFLPQFIQLRNATGDAKGGGTRTGRMSSTPNIQNLDNFMKQFIIADDGWVILSADYSQIELRLMASYAGEEALKQMFIEGRDPHTEMAALAFRMEKDSIGKKSKERRIAKEINFGFLYGMFARKFASRVLRATDGEIVLTTDEAKDFREAFFQMYPYIKQWHEAQFAQACLDGYVTTRSGRRREYNWANRPQDVAPYGRLYHPLWAEWFQSAYASDWKWRNIAYNTPIQGTGGDGVKASVVLLHEKGPDWLRPFATVHDSIDALVPEARAAEGALMLEKYMIQGMERYMTDIPTVVEVTVGKSWANEPKGMSDVSDVREVKDDYGLWFQSDFQKELAVAA